MEKKRLIRTLLTVLPIILVPLIVERKRIKDHPDVQKLNDKTAGLRQSVSDKSSQFASGVSDKSSKAASAVSNKSSDLKQYVSEKKQEIEEKRQAKKEAKANDPERIKAKGDKLEKQNAKKAEKMAKKLEKNIEKRHKKEDKDSEATRKRLVKELKDAQKYEKKVGLVPGGQSDKQLHNKGEELEQENKDEAYDMNRILEDRIEQRLKAEEEARRANEEERIAEIQKHENKPNL